MWLRFWWTQFGRFLRLDSLPAVVGAAEGFSRFLFHSNQFTVGTGRVRPPAMMPYENEEKQRLETSIFRSDRLEGGQIWALGYQYVENLPAGRRIRARGLGAVSDVLTQGLLLDVNGNPYPRHVDIVGWADGNGKAARMMLATEIANRMTLETDLRPA